MFRKYRVALFPSVMTIKTRCYRAINNKNPLTYEALREKTSLLGGKQSKYLICASSHFFTSPLPWAPIERWFNDFVGPKKGYVFSTFWVYQCKTETVKSDSWFRRLPRDSPQITHFLLNYPTDLPAWLLDGLRLTGSNWLSHWKVIFSRHCFLLKPRFLCEK